MLSMTILLRGFSVLLKRFTVRVHSTKISLSLRMPWAGKGRRAKSSEIILRRTSTPTTSNYTINARFIGYSTVASMAISVYSFRCIVIDRVYLNRCARVISAISWREHSFESTKHATAKPQPWPIESSNAKKHQNLLNDSHRQKHSPNASKP